MCAPGGRCPLTYTQKNLFIFTFAAAFPTSC